MYQQWVEVIKVTADFKKSRAKRDMLMVAPEKRVIKGVEQGREGQFNFRVSVIDGGVNKGLHRIVLYQDIATPYITSNCGEAYDTGGTGRSLCSAR